MSASKRTFNLALLLLLAFVLQILYGGSMEIRSARPNLALTALLVASLFVPANTGAVFGACIGLLEASYVSLSTGAYIVTRSLAGWSVGALEVHIFRDNALVAMATVLAGTILVEVLFFLISPQPHIMLWAIRTIQQGLYNCFLALPFYFAMRRITTARKRP